MSVANGSFHTGTECTTNRSSLRRRGSDSVHHSAADDLSHLAGGLKSDTSLVDAIALACREWELDYHPTQLDIGISASTHEEIQDKRVRIDARKWIAAKLLPKKYGDLMRHAGEDGGPVKVLVTLNLGAGAPPKQQPNNYLGSDLAPA